MTKDCLNLGTGGEGKTMGLAPFGGNSKSILDFPKLNMMALLLITLAY